MDVPFSVSGSLLISNQKDFLCFLGILYFIIKVQFKKKVEEIFSGTKTAKREKQSKSPVIHSLIESSQFSSATFTSMIKLFWDSKF